MLITIGVVWRFGVTLACATTNRDSRKAKSLFDIGLIVQHHVQQRTVYLNAAVVFDEAEFSEFVHEEAYTCARCSHHLRERFLTDLRDDGLRPALLAEVREQQQKSCQSLLAGIEQLVDEVLFDTNCAGQKVCDEHLGERGLLMN